MVLLVVGHIAFSIVYSNFRTFDPMLPREDQFNDTSAYLDIYFGRPVGNELPHRYARFLVPYLARLVPDIPKAVLGPNRTLDSVSQAGFKFAVVNLAFLVATSLVLYCLMLGMGLSCAHSLLGAVLFLGLPQVIQAGGAPVVDTAYWFFLALAVLAVQRQNLWLLVFATLVGSFAKELVFWVIPFIFLAPFDYSCRLRLVFGVVPALAIYLALRLGVVPAEHDVFLSGGWYASRIPMVLAYQFSLNGIKQLVMAFGLLWIPCIYALIRRRAPTILSRWAWFVPLLLLGTWGFGALSLLRNMTAAFPVVIPLAIVGLSTWVGLGLNDPNEGDIGAGA